MATPIWRFPTRFVEPVGSLALDRSATSRLVAVTAHCWEQCGNGPLAALAVTVLVIAVTPLFFLTLVVDLVRAGVRRLVG